MFDKLDLDDLLKVLQINVFPIFIWTCLNVLIQYLFIPELYCYVYCLLPVTPLIDYN